MHLKRPLTAALLVAIALTVSVQNARAQERRVPTAAELRLSYSPVVQRVAPAVVNVYAAKVVQNRQPLFDDPIFRRFFGVPGGGDRQQVQRSLGSGVIVDASGLVVTNVHVIEGADEVKVSLADKREFEAEIVLKDKRSDLAVLRIKDAHERFPTLEFANSDALEVGDVVLAIGNPFGVGQTVTHGIVSALARTQVGITDYQFFIQTDAAINLGNSGGALVDARGRLVGINSAMMSTTNGSMGIGFAVPINLASSVMQSLIATGTVARGYLGVGVEPLTAELAEAMGKDAKGMVISTVTADSPAAKAGLKQEDVIVAINGRLVDSLDVLRLIIAQTPPGTKVKVRYLREGKIADVDVTLTKLTDDSAKPDEFVTGVTVARVDDDTRRTFRLPDEVDGLVVTEVADTSPYRERFQQGMVIVQVNRTPIEDVPGARSQLRPGRNFCLVWDRGGFRYIPFKNGD